MVVKTASKGFLRTVRVYELRDSQTRTTPEFTRPCTDRVIYVAIERIELVRTQIDLVEPFVTSYGVEKTRPVLYVHVIGNDAEGWGECAALGHALYTSEDVNSCEDMIKKYLIPFISPSTTAQEFVQVAASIEGHPMAKAAVEAALLDYQLRVAGISLAKFFGVTRTKIPSGVAVGIHTSPQQLVNTVARYVNEGYQRVKLKIEPGNDIEPVRIVRTEFGKDLLLQVDTNCAYTLNDASHLAQLDQFNLLLIEQPLNENDLVGHAELAKRIHTPICLDESIVSTESAVRALDMGACSVLNIKPGRVGGFLEAKEIHDVCYSRSIPVWCGGMFETGIGRAANIALAALPGFTLPGDLSASHRYFHQDITTPFELADGYLEVPEGPGCGVTPLPEVLNALHPAVTSYPVS